MQEYKGNISFGTNAWMSLNHYAYVAITAHFENKGNCYDSIHLGLGPIPEPHPALV